MRANRQAIRELVRSIKEVDRVLTLMERTGVQPNPELFSKEPWQMTFEEFVRLFALDALQLTEYGRRTEVETLLRDAHRRQVLEAVVANRNVPQFNLQDYRFKVELYKPIRAYCRRHKIKLD